MKNLLSGISVKVATTERDMSEVVGMRRLAYARCTWENASDVMSRDAIDDCPWVDSLIAYRLGSPIGTMRLIRANAKSLDRIPSYLTWPREITSLLSGPEDRIIEFNRFAVATGENFPGTASALLKAAMAVQIVEEVSLILGEIRHEHVSYYRRFLGMKASSESRSDGILPGEFYLVTGQPRYDIEKLRNRTKWIVPNDDDLHSWKTDEFLSWT